jgi:hypothetical protein
MFVAAFQDNGIGPVLGTAGRTGAGGANEWDEASLGQLLHPGGWPPLPGGANMTLAVRRSLRVGRRAGQPIEDLGTVPDEVHLLTRADLLEDCKDLLARAADLLARSVPRSLWVTVGGRTPGQLELDLLTRNLTYVDVYLDRRPVATQDVTDGRTRLPVPFVEPHPSRLEVQGFAGGELAVSSRLDLATDRP